MNNIVAEVLCVLHWSSDAQDAFNKALKSWRRAGCPPIPMGSINYKAEHKRLAKLARQAGRQARQPFGLRINMMGDS